MTLSGSFGDGWLVFRGFRAFACRLSPTSLRPGLVLGAFSVGDGFGRPDYRLGPGRWRAEEKAPLRGALQGGWWVISAKGAFADGWVRRSEWAEVNASLRGPISDPPRWTSLNGDHEKRARSRIPASRGANTFGPHWVSGRGSARQVLQASGIVGEVDVSRVDVDRDLSFVRLGVAGAGVPGPELTLGIRGNFASTEGGVDLPRDR